MTPQFVLAAILALGAYHADRDDSLESRGALLLPVATAIAAVARTPEEAAALVAQAWHETHFARYVLEGRCSDGPPGQRCDPDAHGVARARGPWQVWLVACRAADVAGEAKCVLGQMRMGLARCSSWGGALASLDGQWRCGDAPARVQTMRKVLATMAGRK